MVITDDEALACFRLLIAMAQADGKLQADERKSLEAAIHRFDVPGVGAIDALLHVEIDVDAELAKITSSDAKEQLYRSAHFVANADGVSLAFELASGSRVIARPSGTEPKAKFVAIAN